MHKFLLIDDHVVVRSGIKLLLSNIYTGSEIHEAKDGESAMAFVKDNHYDFVMLDVQMPNTDSFVLMEYFKANYPLLKVLVFSMNSENIYALRFIKAGAMGFISKEAPMDEIKKAIDQVIKGKKYISEEMLFVLAEGTSSGNTNANPFSTLSAREFEIVSMLLNGKTISLIAADLNLGISTVGTHKGRIFTKLKVTNLLELKELANSYNLK
jgi:two-component system, NarL family, invasion response regulator UvrY